MELHLSGIGRIEALSEQVQLVGDPLGLGFEDRNATEDEVLLRGVPRRARIVEVEEVQGEKENAAEWVLPQRTAEAALSTAKTAYTAYGGTASSGDNRAGPVCACLRARG